MILSRIIRNIVLFLFSVVTLLSYSCSNDDTKRSMISFELEGETYEFAISSVKPNGEMKFEFVDINKNNIPEVNELETTSITVEGEGPITLSVSSLEIVEAHYRFGSDGLTEIVFDYAPSSCPTYSFDEKFLSPETIFTFNTIRLGDLIETSEPGDPDAPVAPTIYEIYELDQLNVDFTLEVSSNNCDGSQARKIVKNGRVLINQ